MRFGSRNQQDDVEPRRVGPSTVTERPPERSQDRAPERGDRQERPVAAVVTRSDMGGAATSSRLRRIAEYFGAQAELLQEMRRQVEAETTPLAELLVRQQQTMREMLVNLDERLRPLNEYADGEEANLAALEQRMHQQGMDFIARSFADYVQMKRDRIEATRQQIGEQRAPFTRYEDDQRNAIEAGLSRFDEDLHALEVNLAEQRKVVMRMLDGMRSEGFLGVKELLGNRESLMIDLVRAGITDPAEVGSRLHALRNELPVDPSNPHMKAVLAVTDAADQRLMTHMGLSGRRSLPSQSSYSEGSSGQDAQPAYSGGGSRNDVLEPYDEDESDPDTGMVMTDDAPQQFSDEAPDTQQQYDQGAEVIPPQSEGYGGVERSPDRGS